VKKILGLHFTILFSAAAAAQSYDPSKVNKKAVGFYTQAQERMDDGNLALAVGLLQQATEADKNYADAWLALGTIYNRMKSYKSGAASFEKAFAIDSV